MSDVLTPPQVKEVVAARSGATAGAPRLRAGQLVRPIVLGVALLLLYLWVHSKSPDAIERPYLKPNHIGADVVQHMKLTLMATLLVLVLAVPGGIIVSRPGGRFAAPAIIGLGNIGQAIPSIGLVVLLTFPLGVGFWTAVIALVAYSVLPVLRNTMAGLQQVEPALIESGRGMGMTRAAVLFRVELPLAVPVILAGVRTALVLTASTATLATFVGGGGLGEGLIVGIKLNRPTLIYTYGILVAVFALLMDWIGGVAESLLRPRGI